jgi:hypothetical protein
MNKDVATQFDVDVASASVSPQFDVANVGAIGGLGCLSWFG